MGKNRDFSKFPNAITVLDNGNVGIGISNPNSTLEIYATTPKITITASNYSGSYRTILGARAGAEGVLQFGNNGPNYIVAGNTATGGSLQFYVNASSDFVTSTNGTLAMVIGSSGNVGIGTNSPSFAYGGGLEVANSLRATLNLTQGSSTLGIFQQDGSAYINNIASGDLIFRMTTGNNERMRLTSGGNLGIGTTSPSSKLHLYDGANPISLKIQRTSVPVYLSDVQPAGTTAASCWSHNVESTSNGSSSWGGFANGSYAGSAIMLNANTGASWITFLAAPSANTNPTERFRIFGDNGYTNSYKNIGNLASTSLSSFGEAQIQRYYFSSQCNNTWRTLVQSINFRHIFIRVWGSDAGTSNYGEYYFTMSFPGYGVSNNANLHYVSGGWNTGGFELSYTNNGSNYYLVFRNSSYYDSNNVATYYMEIIST